VAELVVFLIHLVHDVHNAAELVQFLRENPRITMAMAILLIAGAFVAVLIRKVRRDEPLSIRK
jgi:hypothetical protein